MSEPSSQPETLHGWIADYYAQGMEAEYWLTFQDAALSVDDRWTMEGMIILAPGDELTVFRSEGEVLWSGTIGRRRSGWWLRLLGREHQHWHPPEVPFDTWVGWFRHRPPYRSTLRRHGS